MRASCSETPNDRNADAANVRSDSAAIRCSVTAARRGERRPASVRITPVAFPGTDVLVRAVGGQDEQRAAVVATERACVGCPARRRHDR